MEISGNFGAFFTVLIVLLGSTKFASNAAFINAREVQKLNDLHSLNANVDDSVCTSQACIQADEYLHSLLDESVDPCNDFYNFTCGGWRAKNAHSPITGSILANLSTTATARLIDLLENNATNSNTSSVLQDAHRYMRACKYQKKNDNNNLRYLRNILDNLKDFPLINKSWNGNKYDWLDAHAYLDLELGLPTFIRLVVEHENFIKLTSPRFLFGHFLLDPAMGPSMREIYKDSFKQKLKKLNYTVSDEDADRDIEQFFDFEIGLVNVSKFSDPSVDPDLVIEDRRLAEMDQYYKEMNWKPFFDKVFQSVNITVTSAQRLSIFYPQYYKRVGEFLKRTDKRTIANYIAIKIILQFGGQVVYSFNNDDDEDGAVTQETIENCATETEKYFGIPISYVYDKKYNVDKESLQEIESYVDSVKNSLSNTLQTSEWMDDETKLFAQAKLNNMSSVVSIPGWIKSESDLKKLYSTLGPLVETNYAKTYQSVTSWMRRLELLSLRKQWFIFQNLDESGVSNVNAAYFLFENRIRILTGIITPPYFNKELPLALNFGRIGFIVGHEILHGFDNEGSLFDATGKYKIWWKNETRKIYNEKSKCFVDQYNEFNTANGLLYNSSTTVNEDIADNGGVHQSFAAYKVHAALVSPKKDLSLPLKMKKYTTDQLFFISRAGQHCENYRWMEREKQNPLDIHSDNQARVMLPYSNSPHFTKAFNCPVGSRMNPVHKCHLL